MFKLIIAFNELNKTGRKSKAFCFEATNITSCPLLAVSVYRSKNKA